MTINKKKVKSFIAFCIFMILVWQIFIHLTYLFRNTERHARQNILGIYEEPKDSLDVVYIGTSSVYRYWSPMEAWKQQGIVSYNYSVSAMEPSLTISAIEDVKKHQTPDVFIFEVRRFLSDTMGVDVTGSAVRNVVDSWDYSFNRIKAIKYLCDIYDVPWRKALPTYIDLMQYHNNKDVLGKRLNWELSDNRVDESIDKDNFYKGFAIAAKHTYQQFPTDELTEERKELNDRAMKMYIDILEYCKANEIELLLVSSPFCVSADKAMRLNTMEDIANEYGYNFLNSNKYYDEMGIDFATDFYNGTHVNILGAKKYTTFLAKYLVENYKLDNHKDESAYASWNELYERYKIEEEIAINDVNSMVREKNQALKDEKRMKETEQALEWLDLSDNNNMTLFIAIDSSYSTNLSEENKLILKNYGILQEHLTEGKHYLGIYNGDVIYGNSEELEYEGNIGTAPLSYKITTGESVQILLGDVYYLDKVRDGIHIVVFDNNIEQVVDVVNIIVDDSGELKLKHAN